MARLNFENLAWGIIGAAFVVLALALSWLMFWTVEGNLGLAWAVVALLCAWALAWAIMHIAMNLPRGF